MSQANNLLEGGCVGNLKNMRSKIESVDSKRDKIKSLRKGKEGKEKSYAEDAIDDAKDAVKYAEKVLKFTADEIDSDPCVKIDKAFKKLTAAYTDLGKAESKLNQKDKKDKEETTKTDETKTDDAKDDTPKMIKCEYCGSMNDAKLTKCKSCGAELHK